MSFSDILQAYWVWFSFAGMAVILGIWARLNWDLVRFRLKVYRYSFPFFGSIAQLRKKTDPANGEHGKNGWYDSEVVLCNDFCEHIRNVDESEYLNFKTYLKKAGDSGRRPTPFAIWVLIVALVVAEAWGFSYVLSGWAILNASETTQKYGAFGIAFILSVVLVGFTHLAGHALHRNREVQHAIKTWDQDKSDSKPVSLGSIKEFDHEDDQSLDDGKGNNEQIPPYQQKIARVGWQIHWGIPIVTIVLVVSVAIGATYVRGKALEESMGQETVGINKIEDSGNPFGRLQDQENPLVKNQIDADNQATEDLNKAHIEGGWTAFILLSIIFVFLQILAVIFGMKWGFIGKNSRHAYKELGNGDFSSFRDFEHHYLIYRAKVVQGLLSSLQQKMKSHARKEQISITPNKNFLEFLKEERRRKDSEKTGARTQSRVTTTQVSNLDGIQSAQKDTNENEVYDGYSDKNRNKIVKKITIAELESLATKGEIDDACFVLKENKWIKFGDVRTPELPMDDTPPLPN